MSVSTSPGARSIAKLENAELASRIITLAEADPALLTFVADRPGHDFRYGVTADRVHALGWRPATTFEDGLAETVAWYAEHLDWLREAHEVDVVTAPRPPAEAAP